MAAEIKKLLEPVLAELTARLAAAPDDDAKKAARDDFLTEVESDAPEFYNAIHAAAFAAGRGEAKKLKEKSETKVKALETELAEAKEQLEAAKADKPDIEAIRAKEAAKAEKLRLELDSERSDRQREHRERLMKDARGDIESALVAQGFRPRAAKAEVLRLVDEGFVRLAEDGAAVEYRQLADPENAYPAPRGGAKPFDALVKALRKDADPNDIASATDRGAGVGPAAAAPRFRAPGTTGLQNVPQAVLDEKLRQRGTDYAAV